MDYIVTKSRLQRRIAEAIRAKGYEVVTLFYDRPQGYIEMQGPDGGWYVEGV